MSDSSSDQHVCGLCKEKHTTQCPHCTNKKCTDKLACQVCESYRCPVCHQICKATCDDCDEPMCKPCDICTNCTIQCCDCEDYIQKDDIDRCSVCDNQYCDTCLVICAQCDSTGCELCFYWLPSEQLHWCDYHYKAVKDSIIEHEKIQHNSIKQ